MLCEGDLFSPNLVPNICKMKHTHTHIPRVTVPLKNKLHRLTQGANDQGGDGVSGGGQKREMRTERDFAWGLGCTMQCADAVMLSCALETCMFFLINVTSINSILKKSVLSLLNVFCLTPCDF